MKEIKIKELAYKVFKEEGTFKTDPKTLARMILNYFDPSFFVKSDEAKLISINNPDQSFEQEAASKKSKSPYSKSFYKGE